ncbi:MAG: hypothetical protein HS099_13305 [Ardenticatenaceae bacterium]|nr:hypothetical protein [Ardenticatenaceae bacterium]
MRLFVERATAVRPQFCPDRAECDGVAAMCQRVDGLPLAAMCQRVDGLPLAIELAAARVPLLPPPTLPPAWITLLPCSAARRPASFPATRRCGR